MVIFAVFAKRSTSVPTASDANTGSAGDQAEAADPSTSGWRPRPPKSSQADAGVVESTACHQDYSAPQTSLLLCLLLGLVLAFGFYRYATTVPHLTAEARTTGATTTPLKVNPNTAPWWELTVLPGVGEVTAKKIVDYRDTRRRELALPDHAPVFRSAADLKQVKGIGPKKSKGMEAYLVFEATAERKEPSSAPPAPSITQTTERTKSPGQ